METGNRKGEGNEKRNAACVQEARVKKAAAKQRAGGLHDGVGNSDDGFIYNSIFRGILFSEQSREGGAGT